MKVRLTVERDGTPLFWRMAILPLGRQRLWMCFTVSIPTYRFLMRAFGSSLTRQTDACHWWKLANLPPCLIGVEAFVGAHHLSRKLDAWSRLGGHRLSQHRCC